MALDLGDAPDWIDPERKRKITGGQHPFASNPAFPKEPGPGAYKQGQHPQAGRVRSYAEFLASESYPRIVQKLRQVLGNRMPRGPHAPMQIMQMMMQAVEQVMEYEQGHEAELEDLAIETVLGLDEFAAAKEAYEAGELNIVATLTRRVDKSDMQLDPEEPEEEKKQELEIPQIAMELNAEQEKRRMINMMMQGAAINKNHAYYLVRDKLDQLNPGLVNLYAIMMAGGELAYWIMPEDLQRTMMSGGDAAGAEKLEFDEGIPTIRAQAVVFPVLIQELVKGLMEYLSYNQESDPETRGHTYGQTDTLANEIEDINYGAPAWRQIIRMIDDPKMMPYVYRHLVELPTTEFNQRMQQILRGDPEGKRFIDSLINEIRQEREGGQSEPPPEEFGGGEPEGPEPAGGGPGEENDDWWKKEESRPEGLARRFLD